MAFFFFLHFETELSKLSHNIHKAFHTGMTTSYLKNLAHNTTYKSASTSSKMSEINVTVVYNFPFSEAV